MNEKSLGQIASEAGITGRWYPQWAGMTHSIQQQYEDRAQAVADVVRKQVAAECAKICEDLPTPVDIYYTDAVVYEIATLDCEAAIKARFGLDAGIEND